MKEFELKAVASFIEFVRLQFERDQVQVRRLEVARNSQHLNLGGIDHYAREVERGKVAIVHEGHIR
jgi:hypothetical protein